MLGIVGKKLEMSRMFQDDGRMVPFTIIEVLPSKISQVKTEEKEKYNAVQISFGTKREKLLNKPKKGHLKKAGIKSAQGLKEFRVETAKDFELGKELNIDEVLKVGEKVKVTGVSKGKGFQGVMKRHGFGGGRATHGGRCHRIPGSIGQSATPSTIHKNKRLPGHMGRTKATVRNLEVLSIEEIDGKKYIALKGAVPGARNSIVTVQKTK